MATVGQVIEELSRKQSEIAIWQAAVAHLQIMYLSTDSGPAEAKLYREDHGVVPEEHIHQSISKLETMIQEGQQLLQQLQALLIASDDDSGAAEDEEDESRPVRGKRGVRSANKHYSPPSRNFNG
jgi:hypothetical protein